MTEEAISYIMQKMSEWLDNNQMIRLEKTLFLYRFNIEKVLAKSDKNVCAMNADDIRQYLSMYQETNGVTLTSNRVRNQEI